MRLRHFPLLLLRRSAQAINLSIDVVRRTILAPFIITGMAFYPEYFDRDYYRSQPGADYVRRTFPFLHFVMHGAWTLQDPHPRYSQRDILRNHPSLNWPPFVNSVLSWRVRLDHSIAEDVDPAPPEPTAALPRTATRLEALWPRIELDAAALSDSVSSITPTAHVKRHVLATQRAWPVASEGSRAVVKLLDQLHDEIDFLFVAPWLGIRGGGERSTERYFSVLAAHYPENRIAILLPDNVHRFSDKTRSDHLGLQVLAINDHYPTASHAEREMIFNRILINLRPKTMHVASSFTAWNSLKKSGKVYKDNTRAFVTIYSDIRINDGEPVGYYHNYLPYIIDDVAGVFCDNRRIIRNSMRDYSLTREQCAKFFYVPTPVVGLAGEVSSRDFAPYTLGRTRRSLWMSRIAIEKRIELLSDLATLLPDREFHVYGAVLEAQVAVDPRLLDQPNIHRKGEFERLEDIPAEQFDSYVFTSWYEGMPLAVLEAVRLGLPVVAPDVGGIAELIDGDTGWLVPERANAADYAAALAHIEADPGEAARRVRNAQARLAEVHSQKNFERVLRSIPGYIEPYR